MADASDWALALYHLKFTVSLTYTVHSKKVLKKISFGLKMGLDIAISEH